MPRRDSYVPTHRGPRPDRPARTTPSLPGLRGTLTVSGVALLATGLAVSSGIVLKGGNPGDAASAALASRQVVAAGGPSGSPAAADLGDRAQSISRSVERSPVDAAKKRALSQQSGGQVTRTEDLSSQDPRTVAKALLPQFGFSADQFSCLDEIYSQESGWNVHADNPSSSAYGIPQALPGSKMASAGSNWESDPATQIKWGLGYIKGRYGSPCSAWSFKQGHGWY